MRSLNLFETLKEAGVTIGIGTGRPELETIEPFKHLNWLKHFDLNYIVTADDVWQRSANYLKTSHLPSHIHIHIY